MARVYGAFDAEVSPQAQEHSKQQRSWSTFVTWAGLFKVGREAGLKTMKLAGRPRLKKLVLDRPIMRSRAGRPGAVSSGERVSRSSLAMASAASERGDGDRRPRKCAHLSLQMIPIALFQC
jgi:hypothetical protein